MKQKKDILFLCQFFYPEYISSAQLPYETVQDLHDSGFSVGVLCGYPHEYYRGEKVPYYDDSEGFSVHRLRYIQTGRKGFLGRLVNYFSFIISVMFHIFEISRYRAVAVYSNPPIAPWIAAIACRLFGSKLVFICYDAYPEVAVQMGALREQSLIHRLMNHINHMVFSHADAVVALSSEMKRFLAENRPIAPERIHVIPNWADDVYGTQREIANPIFRKLRDRFVVSYFGNMGTAQDMKTIVDAIRILNNHHDVYFLFAGHGNKKDEIERIVREEKIENASVYDFLHGDDFADALSVSNAALVSLEESLSGICVPSKTYTYMMYGLPILAVMNESDIVSDLNDGAGIWVRKNQFRELANAIVSLAQNPERAESMGEKSREIFLEKYTRRICTDKYVKLFRNLL